MKNINTQSHWNTIWEKEGRNTWRTYPTIFNFVLKWIKENSSLIDLGCGNGVFLNLVKEKKKGMALMGLDISTIGIRQLKEFYGIVGIVSKLPEIPYPIKDNQFDYVTMFDVLEHLTDDQETVRNAFRILKPGGWFILAVPTTPPKGEHVRAYTEESTRQLLALRGRNLEVIGIQEKGSVFQGRPGHGAGFLWVGRSQK